MGRRFLRKASSRYPTPFLGNAVVALSPSHGPIPRRAVQRETISGWRVRNYVLIRQGFCGKSGCNFDIRVRSKARPTARFCETTHTEKSALFMYHTRNATQQNESTHPKNQKPFPALRLISRHLIFATLRLGFLFRISCGYLSVYESTLFGNIIICGEKQSR